MNLINYNIRLNVKYTNNLSKNNFFMLFDKSI